MLCHPRIKIGQLSATVFGRLADDYNNAALSVDFNTSHFAASIYYGLIGCGYIALLE
jgi:hypothetical protein